MSQKVHAKSLRAYRWQQSPHAFFTENGYAFFLNHLFFLSTVLSQTALLFSKYKTGKALTKRRQKKSVYKVSMLCSRSLSFRSTFVPLLWTHPRTGFAQKYYPVLIRSPPKNVGTKKKH